MSGGIFVLSGEELVEMHEQPYDSEDLLQTLLAKYPNLLAGGDQLAGSPRRWLLVKRETGVPDHEGGGSRWSLDHLFIDQEAVPTLVEVKQSDDTRIRREVVGQMLDYAANGVVYWPAGAAAFRVRVAVREGRPGGRGGIPGEFQRRGGTGTLLGRGRAESALGPRPA